MFSYVNTFISEGAAAAEEEEEEEEEEVEEEEKYNNCPITVYRVSTKFFFNVDREGEDKYFCYVTNIRQM